MVGYIQSRFGRPYIMDYPSLYSTPLFAQAKSSHGAQSTTRTPMYGTPGWAAERRPILIYSISHNIYVQFHFVVIPISFLTYLFDSCTYQLCQSYAAYPFVMHIS